MVGCMTSFGQLGVSRILFHGNIQNNENNGALTPDNLKKDIQGTPTEPSSDHGRLSELNCNDVSLSSKNLGTVPDKV